MTPTNPRERFLELAVAVRQLLGAPSQTFVDDPTMPARFDFTLDGVTFEALHLPQGQIGSHQMLLQCRMGTLDASDTTELMRMALEANQALARTRGGVFGMDPATQELVIGIKQSLDTIAADELREGARHMAAIVGQWRAIRHEHAH